MCNTIIFAAPLNIFKKITSGHFAFNLTLSKVIDYSKKGFCDPENVSLDTKNTMILGGLKLIM